MTFCIVVSNDVLSNTYMIHNVNEYYCEYKHDRYTTISTFQS